MNPHVFLTGGQTADYSGVSVATGRPPTAKPRVTRRSVGLILLGAACSATAVLQIRPFERGGPGPGVEAFDETYLGRRIVGTLPAGPEAAGAGAWQVTVDGEPLHLMRRADGTYLSMVDHYAAHPTALAAVKAAVAELGDQKLRPHEGGR
ncbi:tyrosinase family oxidase copper chaperone [Streptomyces sp. NBC_00498]|uniref:tyrosinase family oxidase copper chaperone n=1 Tax=Streptomyces sp. NBC_00498 TaxID=2975760 RepID=UPI002E16D018